MNKPDDKVLQMYSDLAKAHNELNNARLRTLAETTKESVPDEVRRSLSASSYSYSGSTAFGGLFFMAVDTTLTSNGRSYYLNGMGGGLGFGAAVSWGTAWLNYSIESIVNWEFTFEANIGLATVNINWVRLFLDDEGHESRNDAQHRLAA